MQTNRFKNLSLNEALLRALKKEGYREPTAVQEQAIPLVLGGNDLLATAQTGTGKTAAFSLPILHTLHERKPVKAGNIRALVLTPTRELALQIEASFRSYGRFLPLRATVVVGGVSSSSQIKALGKRPDILVATPGRLLDLYGQGYISLDRVEMLVLDEADRMLDMGFVRDVRRIVSRLPRDRQTLFFSATLSQEITGLASDMLRNPSMVEVTPPASVAGNIEQKVLFVDKMDRRDLLTEILKGGKLRKALVFTRTKRQADRIKWQLSSNGISAEVIHSDKTQSARQRALSSFDRGSISVLIGTDIVARGIDVDGISHVINYEMPNDPESYVHRIGRTARAGAEGTALSFCTAEEVTTLLGIERLTKRPLTAVSDHPFHSSAIASMHERISAPPVPQEPWGRSRKSGRKKRAGRHIGR